ncbi:MAG: hypothetical protein Q7J85_04245 [Bacillota bacterium]|nr:hypothetical protein [Bacillota bacterium]
MKGQVKKVKEYLSIIVLGFVLFGFSLNFSSRSGEVIFTYNMNNLGRGSVSVQNPDGSSNFIYQEDATYLRIF